MVHLVVVVVVVVGGRRHKGSGQEGENGEEVMWTTGFGSFPSLRPPPSPPPGLVVSLPLPLK